MSTRNVNVRPALFEGGRRSRSKRGLLAACLVFVTVQGASDLASTARAAGLDPVSPWPMFHRDLAHGGRSNHPLPTRRIAWSRALSDTIEYSSAVLAGNGTIYIGDQGKELWALNPSGYPLWSYHTGGNIRYSTPAVGADGTIFVGSADGKLYAIRPDGTLRWASQTGGAVKTAPAIAPDGTVYVGSDDRKLWAFYPDGATRWTFTTADTVRSSPVVGADGTIYFGSNDRRMYAVFSTGGLRWSAATGGPIKGSPALNAAGDVIFGSGDGFLYSVSPAGALNWATYTGQNIRSTPAIGITGKIYLGLDTAIAAFHDDGDPAWDYDTGARVLSTPAVHTRADLTEVIICGSDNGTLYLIDRGALLWSLPLNSPIRTSPSMSADGHVYVGTLNGFLHSIGEPLVTDVEDAADSGFPQMGESDLRLLAGPNPMRPGESLSLRLIRPSGGLSGAPAAGPGLLTIADAAGRQVLRLETRGDAGLSWNEVDRAAAFPASGVYLLRWTDGRRSASGNLVFIR